MSEYYKLGVAVSNFKHNSSFQYGRKLLTQLMFDSTSYMTDNKIYCYYTNPYIPQVFSVGDRIILGPSSYPGYESVIEDAVITNANSFWIELDSQLRNRFSLGDDVTGIGSRLPAGWLLGGRNGSISGPNNLWYSTERLFYDINQFYNASNSGIMNLWRGYVDKYRYYLYWTPADGSGSSLSTAPVFYRDYGDVLIDRTVYRFGFIYRGTNEDEITVTVNDGGSDFISSTIPDISGKIAWTQFLATGTTIQNANGCVVKFYANASSSKYIVIDDIFMEHAKGTDGNDDGVFTFNELPDYESESYDEVVETKMKLVRGQSGGGFGEQESGLGDRDVKYVLTMTFSNVDSRFYYNLKILEGWQKQKYLLCLHPVTSIAMETKPILYGIMTLSNFSKESWDHSKVSFTFTFEEA